MPAVVHQGMVLHLVSSLSDRVCKHSCKHLILDPVVDAHDDMQDLRVETAAVTLAATRHKLWA